MPQATAGYYWHLLRICFCATMYGKGAGAAECSSLFRKDERILDRSLILTRGQGQAKASDPDMSSVTATSARLQRQSARVEAWLKQINASFVADVTYALA